MRKSITASGYTFSYMELGDGPPLVFVHGSLLDYRYWTRELEYFSGSFHAIAISRRHHWPTVAEGAFTYSALAQTDDVIAVLEQLDVGPVHLLGHSYGGYLAAKVACLRPDFLFSLTLVEPGGPVEGQVPGVSRNAEYSIGAEMIARGETARGVAHFMDNVCAQRKRINIGELYQSTTHANAITLMEQVRDARPCLKVAELSSISCPVLLMLGELSHSPFPETLERLYELIASAEKAVILNASHMVNMDNYSAFTQVVEEFLLQV